MIFSWFVALCNTSFATFNYDIYHPYTMEDLNILYRIQEKNKQKIILVLKLNFHSFFQSIFSSLVVYSNFIYILLLSWFELQSAPGYFKKLADLL